MFSRASSAGRGPALLETLFASASVGLAHLDRNFRFVRVNGALAAMHGRPAAEIEGRTLEDVHPELAGGLRPILESVLRTGEPVRRVAVSVRAPATPSLTRELLVDFEPLRGERGQVDGVVALGVDVTERHDTEQALRQSEERFRTLVAELPIGVLVQGPNAEILLSNPRAIDLLGLTEDRLLGRTSYDPTWDVIHDDGSPFPGETHPVPVALATGRPVRDVVMGVHHPRRGRVWLLVNAEPQFDAGGRVRQVICTFADITEQRRLESNLQQAQRLEVVGRLAGGVAHDFNNLLTVIQASADFARRALDRGESPGVELHEILEAAQRAAALTRQLLAFSRRQVVRPEAIDLNELAQSLEQMLRRVIPENVQLETRLAGAPVVVRADRGQLEQVLTNLVVNARDAMPEGGRVTIEVERRAIAGRMPAPHGDVPAGDYGSLAVSDTGPGLSPEAMAHLFEPFFTTKASQRGTGLGLATSFSITRQHGGHILVTSRPGSGARFEVLLPASAESRAEDEAPREAGAPTGGHETLLLVEDEDAVRDLAARVLVERGYRVLVARDGLDALRVLGAHVGPLDLLVTDVVMPRLGGRSLAEQLQELRPGLRVLFTSGYADSEVAKLGLGAPGVGYLEKPYLPGALAARVRAMLDGPPRGVASRAPAGGE